MLYFRQFKLISTTKLQLFPYELQDYYEIQSFLYVLLLMDNSALEWIISPNCIKILLW